MAKERLGASIPGPSGDPETGGRRIPWNIPGVDGRALAEQADGGGGALSERGDGGGEPRSSERGCK